MVSLPRLVLDESRLVWIPLTAGTADVVLVLVKEGLGQVESTKLGSLGRHVRAEGG